MKVLLTVSPELCRNGYTNICPSLALTPPVEKLINENFVNLDPFCDDGELTELLVLDGIESLASTELDKALDNWLKKIAHGGKIILVGNDLRSIALSFIKQKFTADEFNMLLFGRQINSAEFKHCCLNMNDLLKLLTDKGLRIIRKNLTGVKYTIEALRP